MTTRYSLACEKLLKHFMVRRQPFL